MASVETAIHQWQEGQRRLGAADPRERAAMERIVRRVVDELRRRLGGPFSTGELADLYEQGTDWCLDIAITTAPDNPGLWDSRTVADAAFARYVREATDFAGGRRVGGTPPEGD